MSAGATAISVCEGPGSAAVTLLRSLHNVDRMLISIRRKSQRRPQAVSQGKLLLTHNDFYRLFYEKLAPYPFRPATFCHLKELDQQNVFVPADRVYKVLSDLTWRVPILEEKRVLCEFARRST